jgi:hypothetical protein
MLFGVGGKRKEEEEEEEEEEDPAWIKDKEANRDRRKEEVQ